MNTLSCSVLMCVYAGDNADWLDTALESLGNQRQLPDQVVIVEDGPLGPALRVVLDAFVAAHPGLCRLVPLAQNAGLVQALNTGLGECHGDLLIRMDADDIAHPDRIRQQCAFMAVHPEIGVLGTAMLEFRDDPARPLGIKHARQNHDEIRRQLPWRNPVNHPTVCLRRQLLPDTGYPDLQYLEDYFLWSQLLATGVRFHNLESPLLSYRFNDRTLARRGGWVNFRNEVRLRWWMTRQGLCGLPVMLMASGLQLVLRFAPLALRRYLWRRSRQTVDTV